MTFAEASKRAGSFGLFLRSLVGLDRAAAEHFETCFAPSSWPGFCQNPCHTFGPAAILQLWSEYPCRKGGVADVDLDTNVN